MPPQTLSQYFSGMPDLSDVSSTSTPLSSLSDWENKVLHIVKNRWPTSSLEIAEFLGHTCNTREQKRLLSSRVVYHVKKLVEKKHVISKRFGNALIVWPYEVETLRIMHEMMVPNFLEKSSIKKTEHSPAHHSVEHAPHEKKSSREKWSTKQTIPVHVHISKKSIWKEEH